MLSFLEHEQDSYIELAKLAYDRPESKTIEEFVEDVSRFKYVKRLLNRYSDAGDIKVRLVLNHLILIFNVFEKDVATYILINNNKADNQKALRTFLYFMNQLEATEEELDQTILKELSLI
jgi:hypothetical protein